MSEPIDVAVVADLHKAQELFDLLKHNGIRHVEFWPEDMLSSGFVSVGPVKSFGREPQGPFHIRVREGDVPRARLVLSSSGLLQDAPDATPTEPP